MLIFSSYIANKHTAFVQCLINHFADDNNAKWACIEK